MSFQELNLDSLLLRAIEASGFRSPTEVQRQVIPLALKGRDVMASAQTGTGKTAAFVLPALQRLLTPSKARGRGPRVLV
ncbi:MAG: DEAD/DEAH box helicase, partial [Gammaproteobacteria bacterium]|nr:DEAD/DEAH box helicase [Gammaproteobacteria bacterium]